MVGKRLADRRWIVVLALMSVVVTQGHPAGADESVDTAVYPSYHAELLTDPTHGYEFVASKEWLWASTPIPHLEVFDGGGTSLAAYEPGSAGGLALSSNHNRLFVTSSQTGSIRRLDLTTDPPTELSPISLTGMMLPYSIVNAGGLLWVGDCLPGSSTESVDPADGTEIPRDMSAWDLNSCPQFEDHPTLSGVFYAWSRWHGNLYRLDVSSGEIVMSASWSPPNGGWVADVDLGTDGSTLLVAVGQGAPGIGVVELDPTTLAETGTRYGDGAAAQAVSISAEGHVATGSGTTVRVFPEGSSTPTATWSTVGECNGGHVAERGVDFGPGDDVLFVRIREKQTLITLSNPTSSLKTSTLDVSVDPEEVHPGVPTSISGTLAIPGGGAEGQLLELIQNGSVVGTTTSGAGGAFGFSATPMSQGSHCYTARFAGTAIATGASGSVSVTTPAWAVDLTIEGPANPLPGDDVKVSGTLTLEDDTSPAGSVVTVTRMGEGNDVSLGDAIVGSTGGWNVVDEHVGPGSYRYQVVYAGTETYSSAQAVTDVVVQKRTTRLTITRSASPVDYGHWLILTAKLDVAPGTERRTVIFTEELYRDDPRVIGKVEADARGVAKLAVRVFAPATYRASYRGDSRNTPDEAGTDVRARVILVTRLRGYYDVDGAFRVFHHGVIPKYLIAIGPPLAWAYVRVRLQRLVDGAWINRARGNFPANPDGVLGVTIDPRLLPVGGRFRLYADLDGGATKYGPYEGNTSKPTYFRVTG